MVSGSNRRRFDLMSGVATGVALFLATTSSAWGQQTADAPESDDDVVIVTGYRASLEASTDVKRRSTSIVEAVSAEDIGRLPDNSIAEALSRLPGLTSQRLFGRSQVISLRGLSPDFTTALLNGREQVSAGDNRGVEFDQYPSELLSSAVVYKTPDAGLLGAGLAGTVDLRTVRPLEKDGRTFAVGARYEWNDLGALNAGSDDSGYRVTLSYIDQSADGHWGWAFGAALNSSPTQAERWEAWGYPTDSNGAFVLGGAKPYVQSSTLDRDGYFGVLQYEPSPTFSTTIDMFYSTYEEEQILRGIELPLAWSAAQLQPGYNVENGFVNRGQFNGVEGVVRNDIRTRDTTVQSLGWNARWQITDDWALEADASYSSVERNDLDLETYSGTGPGGGVGAADNMAFTVNGDGVFVFSPQLNYADPNLILLTDPQGWGQAGFIKEPKTDDELTAFRLSAERSFDGGPLSSVVIGVNRTEREKNKDSIENFVDLTGGNNQTVAIPASALQGSTSLAFIGIPGMVSYNPLALIKDSSIYTLRPLLHNDVVAKRWGVTESVTTYYMQFNVDTEMAQVPVRGNFGLQIVNTDQESTGASATGNGGQLVVVPRTAGDTYTELLPSLNLSFNVMEDTYLRFALARTLSRARMDDMRASFQFGWNASNLNSTNINQSYWNGNGGNPALRPWMANAVDLSLERYFGGAGYIAIAAFYKDLENYIYKERVPFDFTGYPTANPGDVPALNVGLVETPQNAQGGYMRGLEATISLPAEILLPSLKGFGVLVNASTTDSDIQVPGNPSSALPGLSETVVNSTLYYERGGFEARVSNRYRSDFLGEVTGFGAGRELREVSGESIIDAQIGYRFQDRPLSGLSILLQGSNLTDEPFSTYINGDERLVKDYQRYGKTFLFGVNYRR